MSKKDFFIPDNFGALPPRYSQYESSKVIIIPVPYEQTVSYKRGTKEGPRAIIEASKNIELYDEELEEEIYRVGIHTMDEIELLLGDPKDSLDKIFDLISQEIGKGRLMIALGGEHSITVPSVRAHKEVYKNLSVLQLDAHADLRDSYLGTKYSHACVVKRLLDEAPVVQVGIRSLSKEEASLAKKRKDSIFYAKDLYKKSISYEEIIHCLSEEVYVTIDLDVLDPSVMPSVGTPEPGGLQWYDMLDFLNALSQKRRIIGFDVVELSPIPGNISPDFLTARLIYKLIGYIYRKSNQN